MEKYVVNLTEAERNELEEYIRRQKDATMASC